jgi:phage virion morphogenesis protein
MPAALTFQVSGLHEASERLRRLNRSAMDELLDQAGAVIASQTRQRIHDEKTAPDGSQWKPWSVGYARTRRANHSLLMNDGHLHDSITHNIVGGAVEIGSNRAYAAVHQYGHGDIPARPYLGISTQNERELTAVIEDWIDDVLGGVL